MEIERKFLVDALPSRWRAAPHARIRQGYFALRQKGIEIRVREKGSQQFITIKAGRGTVRLQEEIRILRRHFAALWPLIRGASISKIRYRIAHQRNTIEVDVFQGRHRGLVTAEVEFRSRREADSFKRPAWLGREITGVRRYANEVLARRGRL
jgi:CYTH domain-containing protein